ncbi:AI-2E family transporter [Klugiella xanthotipulae]|uniref:Putative PurR-regulated permease PerM n=1 Tax=Klugiella xanthotipulae TaxID=244735 RepID=A0A543I5Y3_9MICO|nr:AI-2E family transporter [Klugiella xanthotipulae]TQM66012.1 putative PurR-regulated permease PerM [Klugiella xanthotipulae]
MRTRRNIRRPASRAATPRAAVTAERPPEAEADIAIATDHGGLPRGVSINAFRIGLVGGLGVLASLVIGGMISQLSTVLVYIGVALFLALGLDPLVSWLEQKMPRGLAIGTVVLAVVLVFAGLLFAVIPIIVDQTSKLIASVPDMVNDIVNNKWLQDVQDRLGGVVDIDAALKNLEDFVGDPNNLLSIGGGLLAVGAGVAGGFTGVVIVLILMLYFLASLRSMKQVTYRFVAADKRTDFAEVSEEITQAVGRYVVGQVSLALINGVLSFIFLTIIGAPLPVLLAVIAFIASIIPLVGTLSGAVIISLVCLFASPLTALVAAIYYIIYMQVEAYVLSPRIMNRAVAVPGAVVVIAAVAGGAIGGVLGALVAIPIAASVIIIIQKIVFPRQDAKKG